MFDSVWLFAGPPDFAESLPPWPRSRRPRRFGRPRRRSWRRSRWGWRSRMPDSSSWRRIVFSFGCLISAVSVVLLSLHCYFAFNAVSVVLLRLSSALRQCCFGCVAAAVLLLSCFGFSGFGCSAALVVVLRLRCCFGFAAWTPLRHEGASAYAVLSCGALPVACKDEQFETDIMIVISELYSCPAKMERCKRPAACPGLFFRGER